MKKFIPIILALVLLISACGGNAAEPAASGSSPDFTANELACAVITESGMNVEQFQSINDSYDAEAMSGYVQGFYGLTPEYWEDCAIYRAADGTKADEISIFKLADKADLNTVFNELESYRHGRQGDFFGYAPDQAAICDEAIISISSDGLWAAVLICPEPQKLDEAFFAALNMELPEYEDEPFPTEVPETEPVFVENLGELPEYWLPYTDPEIDDMTLWDNREVVAAIKVGDDSGLDNEGKKLFNEVNRIVGNLISDDMSPLEKERAIYDWLCANCEYDHRHYQVPNNAPRISYEPYGAIVEGEAICLGYATAFQLFMDVLDIECITLVGGAFQSTEDHAWNMVKIDGQWYCVDPTWDAGCDPEWYSYFNVSSEYMALTNHQWDYEAYPVSQPDKMGTGMK